MILIVNAYDGFCILDYHPPVVWYTFTDILEEPTVSISMMENYVQICLAYFYLVHWSSTFHQDVGKRLPDHNAQYPRDRTEVSSLLFDIHYKVMLWVN